jgi:hypothetical protein
LSNIGFKGRKGSAERENPKERLGMRVAADGHKSHSRGSEEWVMSINRSLGSFEEKGFSVLLILTIGLGEQSRKNVGGVCVLCFVLLLLLYNTCKTYHLSHLKCTVQ